QITYLHARMDLIQQNDIALKQELSDIAELRNEMTRLRDESDINRAIEARIASDIPGSKMQTLKDNGRLITFDGQGNIIGLPPASQQDRQMIKEAFETERVQTPPLIATLVGKQRKLMGDAERSPSFALLGPVGTVVSTDRPVFRWQALPEATGYIISVYDSNFTPIAASQIIQSTEWTMPVALERGRIYSWEVTS